MQVTTERSVFVGFNFCDIISKFLITKHKYYNFSTYICLDGCVGHTKLITLLLLTLTPGVKQPQREANI